MQGLSNFVPAISTVDIGETDTVATRPYLKAGPLQHRKGNRVFQHLHLFLDWLASPVGFNYVTGLWGLGVALGLNQRVAAGLLAAMSFWLAFQ